MSSLAHPRDWFSVVDVERWSFPFVGKDQTAKVYVGTPDAEHSSATWVARVPIIPRREYVSRRITNVTDLMVVNPTLKITEKYQMHYASQEGMKMLQICYG